MARKTKHSLIIKTTFALVVMLIYAIGFTEHVDAVLDDEVVEDGVLGGKSISELVTDLSNANWQVQQNAAEALGTMGADAAPAASALLQMIAELNPFAPPSVSKTAIAALEKIGPAAIPAMVDGLQANRSQLRIAAARQLARLGRDAVDAASALIDALRDGNGQVKREAARALIAVTPNAGDVLVDLLSHEDVSWRRAAGTALEEVAVTVIIDASHLMVGLLDDDVAVRRAVARALDNMRNPSASRALLTSIDDEDVDVRLVAINGLARFGEGDKSLVSALALQLVDPEPRIRRQSALALENIGVSSLDEKDQSVISHLVEALDDTDAVVRRISKNLLTQAGVTHLDGAVTTNMYPTDAVQVPIRVFDTSGDAGIQFVANAEFDSIQVSTPTWRSTTAEISFSLFKWDRDYATTIEQKPIVSNRFTNIADNAWLTLSFAPQPEGEYMWLLHGATDPVGVDTVGVWKTDEGLENIIAYEEGFPTKGSYVSRIHYRQRPVEPFGVPTKPVVPSSPITPPTAPVYNDDHPLYTMDVYPDTWVATDGLGRKLPEHADVGGVREGKYVGLFYWTWHYNFAHHTEPYNINAIIERYPEAIHDLDHPAWGPIQSGHLWNEPLFGYYDSRDRWVLRQHAEMLANAGIDVIVFDTTNEAFTWRPSYLNLFDVFAQARSQGVNTPQMAFMLPFEASSFSKISLRQLYLDIYRPGKYHDLWFYWDGKPLIMAYPDNLDPTDLLEKEILGFFTFRPAQPSYVRGPDRPDHWGWLSVYPQQKFGPLPSGGYEQMTVGIAQNHTAEKGLTAMNDGPDVFGRSHTVQYGRDPRPDSKLYGANFGEQWEYVLEVDPQFVFITGWNEWMAGRYPTWRGVTNAFPDTFNDEFSRDIEPSKGDLKDHYYYQMISYIRQFKGVRPPEHASPPKTIDLFSSQDEWVDVDPTFRYYPGSTMHRDHAGWLGTHYTNTTGRNDIILAKVARDDDHIYFMVETVEPLSPPTDPAWMRLFIDTSSNGNANWEGYEFVINRINPTDEQAIVEKSDGGWNWTEVGKVDYVIKGNRLEIAIPRAMLGVSDDPIDLRFKWSDNMQNDGDILDFYQYGDAAPGGRFQYRYFTE